MQLFLKLCVVFVIGFLGAYYIFVLSLYTKREVSEAFAQYYLKQETRFYNRFQDTYLIRGHIYDTTVERPSFLGKEGFTYPNYDGKGLPFQGTSSLYTQFHQRPQQLALYLKLVTDKPNKVCVSFATWQSCAVLNTAQAYELQIPIAKEIYAQQASAVLGFTSSEPIVIYAIGWQ